jgi:hypothetical protein
LQEHGHKKRNHVPVKEEIARARSQEGETSPVYRHITLSIFHPPAEG